MAALVLPESLGVTAADLSGPLYVAWQLTNECNLCCRHCLEESGPGRAGPDELSRDEAFRVVDQIVAAEVPYVAFSGGEPLLYPHFLDLLDRFEGTGVGLKVETNGQLLAPETIARLSQGAIRSIQVSLDGVTQQAYSSLRPGASLQRVLDAIRNLRRRGVPVEVNFAPTRCNVGQIAAAVDLAHGLGAFAFYTGRLICTGNAARFWPRIAPSEEQYADFFATLAAKAREYEGRMRVCYHELGIAQELRYRLEHPAALFIVLPDGRAKLINVLPFFCGDLRRQTLAEVWKSFQRAWRDPRVARFVRELADNPDAGARLQRLVEL